MVKKSYLFLLIIPIIALSSCYHGKDYHTQTYTQEPKPQTDKKHQHTVTIWIHGTRAVSKVVFPHFFRAIPGIQPVNAYNKKNNLYTIAQTLSQADPLAFPQEDFYLFGWSGKLSLQARIKAAKQLYKDLKILIHRYTKQYGTRPRIRLITHSHGGNVALHLAQICTEKKKCLEIDELILLACPVQKRTANLIKNEIFKKIYSFYSNRDLIQIIDPQGVYAVLDGTKKTTPFFSERRFEEQDNLIQKKVKINGRGISHITFILNEFVRHLPHTLNNLKK